MRIVVESLLSASQAEQRRLEQENKLLKEHIRLLLLSKYGAKSEKLSDAQLNLLEAEPGVSREEVASEAAQPKREKLLKPRAAHGRAPLPAHLPRVEETVRVPDQERHCATCGCPKCCIGHDVAEVLDMKPVELFVRVIKTEKLACPAHPENGVTSGPAAARIVAGGKLSDAFLIDALLKKYQLHQPLYRQSEALWREAKVDVSRSTLCDGVMAIGQLLMLVGTAQRDELLKRDYLQADETPVGVQSPEVQGRNHQAWQWQYSAPGGPVVFDFQMSRGREGPEKFLKGFRGVLQTDAYGGYNSTAVEGIIHAACWAHVRRKFYDLHQAHKSPVAAEALNRIGALYGIEESIRGKLPDKRQEIRNQHARPLLDSMHEWLQVTLSKLSRKSDVASAILYTLGRWPALMRYCGDGRLSSR